MDEFDLEILQTRNNQELMQLLNDRAKSSKRFTLAEVKQRLGLEEKSEQVAT